MRKESGFTIVELMIATTIFAFILLMISFAAIYVGRSFYKAITSARAQEASRNVMDSIARKMEFTGSTLTDNITGVGSNRTGAYCVGGTRYTFAIDKQVSDPANVTLHQQKHALWEDRPNDVLSCTPVNLTLDNPSTDPASPGTDGKELIPGAMRLTDFQINPIIPRYFSIKIGVIAGEDEIIDRSSGDPTQFNCLDSTRGGEFCSAAPLSTTVYRRLAK